MSLVSRLDALVNTRRLLDHPFYRAWEAGTLPREALERYAEQYYHWVNAFPTFLSLTHAQCPDLAARQVVLANLMEEELGPDNHPELWLRFCDALGLEREAVKSSEHLPETTFAISAMREICGQAPFVGGLAALYAYESQQPAVMTSKRRGLTSHFDLTAGHDFFIEHESADIRHSADEGALIDAYGATHASAALAGAQQALDATYALLDGVYTRYVADAA